MLAERAVRALWPLWALLCTGYALLAFGMPAVLPLEAVWIGTVAWVLGLGWALVLAVRRFRWPTQAEALARLDATLPGRPLAALADRQAVGAGDSASAEVWRTHLERMAERVRWARAARPDLRLAARDPYALRYAALGALVLALVFGAPSRVAEVTGMAPQPLRLEAQAPGVAWEGWIQPPMHTGRPSLYLNEVDRPALSVPAGSRVTLRLYGQSGVLTLAESVTGREAVPEPGAPSHDFEVVQPGRIAVQGPGGRSWEITVVADAPPRVRLQGEMTREAEGALRQVFEASDDYGVVEGEAVIALDLDRVERRFGLAADPEPREPVRLDLPMPIAGDRSQFTEALIENLSQHPWANLPVTVRLTVSDALGQTGASDTRALVLPGRRFFDPMAAAVIELRRDLLWTRAAGPRVAELLRAVSHRPEDGVFRGERAYLLLRSALRQLEGELEVGGLSGAVRDEIAEALWDIAVLIEDGDLASAAERLQRAQERLSEAMRRGADQSEIDELMAELREAMRDYIEELARTAPEDGGEQDMAQGERMEVTGDQLQELMDRIQELMEQGRMAEAMELLEQLRQMMENMQVTRGEGGEGGPGQQALEGLGETLREQQGLSDDTFRDLQERFGQERGQQPGQDQQGGRQPGDQQGDQQGEGQGDGIGEGEGRGSDLAGRQRALRDMLRDFEDMDLPGDGTEAGDGTREALDEAGRAMEEAERALRDGDGAGALDRQAEAIEALREGMRGLAENLAQEQGEAGDSDRAAAGDGGTANQRDPLGRDTGRSGRLGTDEAMLPDADIQARARELLEEIRRRSGEQDRPEVERDYLRRLLDRF